MILPNRISAAPEFLSQKNFPMIYWIFCITIPLKPRSLFHLRIFPANLCDRFTLRNFIAFSRPISGQSTSNVIQSCYSYHNKFLSQNPPLILTTVLPIPVNHLFCWHQSILIVPFTGFHNDLVIWNLINQTIGLIDPSAEWAGFPIFQRFRLSNSM